MRPVRFRSGIAGTIAVVILFALVAVAPAAATGAPAGAGSVAENTGFGAGGSAEAGLASTGAQPGDTPPLWADDVMPTPIRDDPFFAYPDDPDRLAARADGELIRHRRAGTVQIGLPGNRLHQFMFRSENSHGDPIAATASLLVPDRPWHGPGPRPVIVNAAAIDSLGATCTPSYALVHKPFEFEIPPFTATVLDRGYAVLVPDHEGPDMAYAAGILAGRIILDSVRAMRRLPALPHTGVGADSRLALTGYSGGAIAAGWAAQLQPVYAPDVEFAGAAIGGVPADFALLPETMNGTLGSGLFIAASFGLAREYPRLLTSLNDFGQSMARSPAKDLCAKPLMASGIAMQKIETFTYPGVLDSPDARAVMAENRLGGMPPKAPVMLFQASDSVFLGDEWIPESGVTQLFDEWCGQGADVIYAPIPGEHLSGGFTSFPMVVQYLSDRLEGVPQAPGCSTQQWTGS
ncbi:lipase family protein [Tomitella fengzijianii]|uniref:Triacylglycerol lipase n=1 Tax=Tomitella fengzijianii TaxID=2597660 RepID=A0A516X2E3_9ACTN|nr:lipase family protein [Tomitella fengzijianii]QDQ97213.1 triacylglycerol lipase [Tomitella fengzijianii]